MRIIILNFPNPAYDFSTNSLSLSLGYKIDLERCTTRCYMSLVTTMWQMFATQDVSWLAPKLTLTPLPQWYICLLTCS